MRTAANSEAPFICTVITDVGIIRTAVHFIDVVSHHYKIRISVCNMLIVIDRSVIYGALDLIHVIRVDPTYHHIGKQCAAEHHHGYYQSTD